MFLSILSSLCKKTKNKILIKSSKKSIQIILRHFLQNFLDKIRVIVNASFADLLITPRPILDNGKWHPVDSFVSGKKSEKFKEVLARILQPNQGKIGVFRHVLNTRKYYISRDPKSDPYFIMDSDSVHIKSILSIPLIYSDEVIGIINLNSSKQNFFKESTADSIQAFSNQVARIYIDKRLNFQIKELTIPFNIFSTSEINRIFINILENYFLVKQVILWEKEKGKSRYRNIHSSIKIEGFLENHNIKEINNPRLPISIRIFNQEEIQKTAPKT